MAELAFDFVGDRIVSIEHPVEQIEEGERNQPVDWLQFHETVELRLVQVVGELHLERVQLELVVLDA